MTVAAAFRAVEDLTSGPTGGFTLWNLIQFGVIGLVLICLAARKWIVPEWVLKASEERQTADLAAKDREIETLKAQVEKLQTVLQDQVIPALTRATEVAATYNEELARRRFTQSIRDSSRDPERP